MRSTDLDVSVLLWRVGRTEESPTCSSGPCTWVPGRCWRWPAQTRPREPPFSTKPLQVVCCVGAGTDGRYVITSTRTQAGPQQERSQWLASCSGDEHAEAVADLLYRREHGTAAEAAADATALARNPLTDFDDFAQLVAQHLENWVRYLSERGT